jgi:hypothetical protein
MQSLTHSKHEFMVHLNHFWQFSYVHSSIHNQMQELLCHVYFSPVGHRFQKTPWKEIKGLGPEISAAKVLDKNNQSNDFL